MGVDEMVGRRIQEIDGLRMQEFFVLANDIGYVATVRKNVRVGGFASESLLVFPRLPEAAELRHADDHWFDELQEVYADFLGDEVGLFDACVVVVVDASKDRAELGFDEFDVAAAGGALSRL